MRKRFFLATTLPCLLLFALGAHADAAGRASPDIVTVGTGGQSGVYYAVGQALCSLVLLHTDHALKCAATPSAGSVANLQAVRAGTITFGVVQSDLQFQALVGAAPFAAAGPDAELRAVFSLHQEPFTVVARKYAAVGALQNLRGKRVNIGNPGSGQHATMAVLLEALGWNHDAFKETLQLGLAQQARALCDNKIDAFVVTVGHPNASVREATTACDAVLVPVTGPEVDSLVANSPYFSTAVIPAGTYRGTPAAVRTFAVSATLVTSAATGEEVVHRVVEAVFANFERLRQLHPALAPLQPERMPTEGLSAPLHPGAERYFREQGWL